MKKIVFLIVTIVAMLSTSAQNLDSFDSFFGKDSTFWNVGFYIIDLPVANMGYYVSGDTSLDGHNYKLINEYEYYYPGFSEEQDNGLICMMREDTLTGRLWFRYLDGREVMVVDMSLSVGDTIGPIAIEPLSIGSWDSTGYYVVIREENNPGGKTLYLRGAVDGRPNEMTFIEGIGSDALFWQAWTSRQRPFFGNCGSDLFCVHKDGEHVYQGFEGLEDCKAPFLEINAVGNQGKMTLCPNPTTDRITIDGLQGVCHIDLYNALGKHVKSMSGDNRTIDVADLPMGVYLIRITAGNHSFTTKLIKK